MEKELVRSKVDYIFNILILLIGITFFIRKVSTILIIIFIVFCIFFKRELKIYKEGKWLFWTISSLFWVELLFLWNSSDFTIAIKGLEKYLSLLVLPVFIIGNFRAVKFRFIIENYARLVFILITFFLIRFLFIEPERVATYLSGNHLWEAGYVIADSFGNHAPNVNLHLTFVSSILLYYFLKGYNTRTRLSNLAYLISILGTSCLIFIINTRVALALMFLGYLLIIGFYFYRNKNITTQFKIGISATFFALLFVVFLVISEVSYIKAKYTTVTFGYMDKIGKLDEISHPESQAFNSLVLRLSVWNSALNVAKENNVLIGVGASDLEPLLFNYYESSEQNFLLKYKLGIHNQYIENSLKFGVAGIISLLCFISVSGYLGLRLKNVLMIVFFLNILIANVFDSYLSLFMGIVYSGWLLSLFSAYYLQHKYPSK